MQKLQEPEFLISSEDCRLLLVLEMTGSVRRTANALRRDVSVVSRQISDLARVAPLVEKINGRWRVSTIGRKMNTWSRDAILSQQRVLKTASALRIATPREFAARVLVPGLKDFTASDPDLQIVLATSDDGVECQLMNGQADLGFACGTPRDPSIKFHRVTPEPFVVVASQRLFGKAGTSKFKDLPNFPYIRHNLFNKVELPFPMESLKTQILFNDWAGVRSASIAGLGWALMPRYTVELEILAGELIEIKPPKGRTIEPEHYGVWWLRERTGLEPWVRRAVEWLKQQKL